MTYMGMDAPEHGAVFMDDDHAFQWVQAFDGDERVGITEWHKTPGGVWCAGFVPFRSYDPEHGWDVIDADPLTLSPSLLCRLCGSHGFIRDGAWVTA